MKKIPGIAGILLILFSCNKDSSSPQVISGNLVTSMTIYSPGTHSYSIDSLSYDNQKNVVGIRHFATDTINGQIYAYSTNRVFSDFSSGMPGIYTLTYPITATTTATEIHQFSYDADNHLIRDTTTVNTQSPDYLPSYYYSYSDSLNICNEYYPASYFDTVSGTYQWGLGRIDSIALSGGNVISQITYNQLGLTGWQLLDSSSVSGYSTYANPFYSPELSKMMGSFAYIWLGLDLISPNLPSEDGVIWTTDPGGKVIYGLTSDSTLIRYNYQ